VIPEAAADELALELFIGDNHNQSRGQSVIDWNWLNDTDRFRGRIEHYKVMAEHILAIGYKRVSK